MANLVAAAVFFLAIHFGVSGTEFTYWRFNLKELAGDVYWKGNLLSFSNVPSHIHQLAGVLGLLTWSSGHAGSDCIDSRVSFTSHTVVWKELVGCG